MHCESKRKELAVTTLVLGGMLAGCAAILFDEAPSAPTSSVGASFPTSSPSLRVEPVLDVPAPEPSAVRHLVEIAPQPPRSAKSDDPLCGAIEVELRASGSEALPALAYLHLFRLTLRRTTARRNVEARFSEPKRIEDLVPGDYEMRVAYQHTSRAVAEGYSRFFVKAGKTKKVDVTLTGGAGVVGGRVVDWRGNACRGVRVSVRRANPGCQIVPDWWKVAITDDHGMFRLDGIPAVPVSIDPDVLRLSGEPFAEFGKFEIESWRHLDAPTQNLRIELARGHRILVEVVSAATGKRIAAPVDVRIDRFHADRAASKQTGTVNGDGVRAEGFVAFERMHAGTYRLVCVGSDRKPIGPEVEVVCGGDATDVSVVLRADLR